MQRNPGQFETQKTFLQTHLVSRREKKRKKKHHLINFWNVTLYDIKLITFIKDIKG